MNKIPMTDQQKKQIEEIYWKWFSTRHLKTFMEKIEQDRVLKKIIDENLNITEDSIKAFLLADTNKLANIKRTLMILKMILRMNQRNLYQLGMVILGKHKQLR